MNSIDWAKVEAIFAEALETADPLARAELIARSCGNDAILRHEVETLLAAHSEAQRSDLSAAMEGSGDTAGIIRSISAEFLIGSRMGDYRLEAVLGEGGTGVVYRAADERAGRTVAVKLLDSGISDHPGMRRRLEQEGKALGRLRHPHIAALEAFGEQDGALFLAMEYVAGETLAARLSRGPLVLLPGLELAMLIAGALAAAHRAGVIHRDLKPSNIMLRPDGSPVLLDFGLCRMAPAEGSESVAATVTLAAQVVGTASYMSPEQAEGKPVDKRSDLFSFGCVLYEMLAGYRAFQGGSRIAILADVLRGKPSSMPKTIPHPVALLVEQCLEKDPAARPVGAGELAEALEVLRARAAAGRLRAKRNWRVLRPRWWAIATAAIGAAGIAVTLWATRGETVIQSRFRQITSDAGLNTEPAISKDGRIIYSSDRAGNGILNLWELTVGSGEQRQLTRDALGAREPAISPDQQLVAYASSSDGTIHVLPLRPGGADKGLGARGRRPRFSPDGKWIVYASGYRSSSDPFAPGGAGVFVIPFNGGQPRRIAGELPSALDPVWSPDSRSILVLSGLPSPGDTGQWWLAPARGGPARLMRTFKTRPRPIEWTPAGILYGASDGYAGIHRIPYYSLPDLFGWPLSGHGIFGPEQVLVDVPGNGRGLAAFADDSIAISMESVDCRVRAFRFGEEKPFLELATGMRNGSVELSQDGRYMVYSGFSSAAGTDHVQSSMVKRDLKSGRESTFYRGVVAWLGLLPDNAVYMYHKKLQRLPPEADSSLEDVCPGLDARFWDISPDGRYGLFLHPQSRRTIGLIDLRTCAQRDAVAAPGMNLYHGHFSPDMKSIVFQANIAPGRARIYVTPFRESATSGPESWTAVSEGRVREGPARWSRDGKTIYYLSERDGSWCAWAVGYDSARGGPVGVIRPVQHFHPEQGFEPLDLSISKDAIAFTVQRELGNLWLASLR